MGTAKIIFCFVVLMFCGVLDAVAEPLLYTGVSLAGAEFGGVLPGVHGVNYKYPTVDELDYFVSKRMNVIRLPFRWERLQRTLYGNFDATEWVRLDSIVQAALDRNLVVVLDPHNYARYHGDLVGSASVPLAAFADFWNRLAQAYGSEPNVWFGLMNEPHTMPTEDWLAAANEAIAGIRAAGANNCILVPGNAWTGAHSWLKSWYGTPNGTVMTGIIDPADNYIIEVHQYLDSDSSGSSTNVVSATIGVERLTAFTGWCRTNGVHAFLGEFGCPRSDTGDLNDPNYVGYVAIDNMLNYMEANQDVWIGWTWWAAGPWWGEYRFTLEPTGLGTENVVDRPQMTQLNSHIAARDDDGDGMLDAWEIVYFGGTNAPNGAAGNDWDNDGSPNVSEYIAGTDPTDATSALNVSIVSSNNTIYVEFSTISTTASMYPNKLRYYDLRSTTSMISGWDPVPGHVNILGDDTTHTHSDPGVDATRFFRVHVRLE